MLTLYHPSVLVNSEFWLLHDPMCISSDCFSTNLFTFFSQRSQASDMEVNWVNCCADIVMGVKTLVETLVFTSK
jgi:hypothetical protein